MSDISILGIDIGGTKIAAGVVSPSGEVLSYQRQLVRQTTEAEDFLAQVMAVTQAALVASPQVPDRVGVGCGGPMRWPAGVVSPLHIPAWRNFLLKDRLTDLLQLPVTVDNDAKAFALGEARFGAGRGAHNLLGMVVSTGVGGGIVSEGRLQHGATGNAGHIGHVIVSDAAEASQCDCGAVGCLTVFASGTWLAIRARQAIENGVVTTLSSLPLAELTTQQIAQAARAGDNLSLELLEEAGFALGRAIASSAHLLDLDRVVIGGGVAESGELLFAPLRAEYARRARLDFSRDLAILPAALGTESGVIGAAALAL